MSYKNLNGNGDAGDPQSSQRPPMSASAVLARGCCSVELPTGCAERSNTVGGVDCQVATRPE